MIFTKEMLICLYKDLAIRIGKQPTKRQWLDDTKTPSDMPIRMNFGNWTNFVKSCGFEPLKSEISIQARLNSIKAHKGKRSMAWKGGRIKDRSGYVLIWKPEHANAKIGGYIHEHRLVMSEHLGRPLESYEYVHHRNGIKSDNRLENLELVTQKVHLGGVVCPYCSKRFSIR
ncbi:HNH endonuclease [Dehalobacter sp. DCM]|uniref:HNH endonuclease n=1 Tax=Dehalobacter sp. DCM TaxID=2907827 RepID=UPI0030812D89|nr:HNH endonuclease [Dehalobacter sp. DCM]